MRLVSIPLGAIALLAGPAMAQSSAGGRSTPPERCNPTAGIVDYRGEKAAPRKLGEMPPATQIYTVYNVVDGCPQPIVVRKGIGANPAKQAPVLRAPPRAKRAN